VRFYEAVGVPAELEICPLAHPTLLRHAGERGLGAIGFRNVYVHDLVMGPASAPPPFEVVRVGAAEFPQWSETLLDGFGYATAEDRRRVDQWNQMLFGLPAAALFLARDGAKPVGAANLLVHGAAASLGGTATRAGDRRRGVQAALLEARLRFAAGQGCSLAVVTADPGGASARNVERARSRLAYTNVRVRLAVGEPAAPPLPRG
jgi:GNAT superfamily N-acetyltransferase